MKREFEFVGNFAISVLLLAGSFALAQSTTTANANKPSSATTTVAVTGSSDQGVPAPQTSQAAADTRSQPTQNQPSATTTNRRR